MLVQQLLLGRLEGLGAAQTAAFVAGWSGALELLARTDLTVPHAPPEIHRAIAEMIERIRAAQQALLDDTDD